MHGLAKLCSGVKEARFDGGDRDSKHVRCLLGRKVPQLTQKDDGSQARAQPKHRVDQASSELQFRVPLLRRWPSILDVDDWVGIRPIRRGRINGHDIRTSTSHHHQPLVDRNAREPGRKSRIPIKGIQVHEGALERLLHYVFRVLVISHHAARDGEDPSFEALKQSAPRRCISGFGLGNEFLLVAVAPDSHRRVAV
jgi:hypothetical protein